MTVSLPVTDSSAYAIAPGALRRWASERLRRHPRPDGGIVYTFNLSGSTCNNQPLEVIMTLDVDAHGRIESATSQPAPHDTGFDAMCAAPGEGRRFLHDFGNCDEAIGLTLHEAAFRNWQEEHSGCFCTSAQRRHKWRNVLQTVYYATTIDA